MAGDNAPNSNFSTLLKLSETSLARKLIFELKVRQDQQLRFETTQRQWRLVSKIEVIFRTFWPREI